MKLICFASLLASATAFTSTGAAFTTQSFNVGERSVNVAAGPAHRTRKATIVMDGKANGTFPSTTIFIVMESPLIDLEMGNNEILTKRDTDGNQNNDGLGP